LIKVANTSYLAASWIWF